MGHANLEQRLHQLTRPDVNGRQAFVELLEACKGGNRVVTDDNSLVSSDGLTIDATQYQVDVTTGDVIINGTFGTIAALSDEDIVAYSESYDLDGEQPAAIADGNAVFVYMLAYIKSEVPTLAFVFGEEGTIAGAAPPSLEDARLALARGNVIADHIESGLGCLLGTIRVQRDDGGAGVTLTHLGAAGSDAIKGARLAGALID